MTAINKKEALNIERIANKEFAEHILTNVTDNTWRCHKKGTGNYSYYVTLQANYILIYGDIGQAFFCVNEDVNVFLKGFHIENGYYDYILGKLQDSSWYKHYDEEVAKEHLKHCFIDEEIPKEIQEALDSELGCYDDFYRAIDDYISDAWEITAYSWTCQAMWAVEALKKFIELRDKVKE